MHLFLEHLTAPSKDAQRLVDELEGELSVAYSIEQRHGFDLAQLFRPGVLFFVARLDGEPVGCGGVAFDHEWAELKRMYVRRQARGRGVAQAILVRLEDEARRRGIERVVLETGDAQHAAIRFYERAGFTRCQAFGAYATMPPHAIARSLFFEKSVAAAPDSGDSS